MVSPVFSLVLALPITLYTSRIPELCFLHVSPAVCGEGVGVAITEWMKSVMSGKLEGVGAWCGLVSLYCSGGLWNRAPVAIHVCLHGDGPLIVISRSS